MKHIIFLFIALVPTLLSTVHAQETDSIGIHQPVEGKSVVYIARRSAVAPLIRFSIYDGDQYLGRLGVNRFFVYECEPGQHVFVAKSENTSYVEAELEAGKVYVLDVQGKMGIGYARVELVPLEKSRKNYEKERARFLKFIASKKGESLSAADDKVSDDDIEEEEQEDGRIMKGYNDRKSKGRKMTVLSSDMYLELP